jgi:hypothetical protein
MSRNVGWNALRQTLAASHLLSHVQEKTPVWLFDPRQQPAKTPQKTRFLTLAAPRDIVSRLPLRKIRQLWWFLSVVEKLIEGNFHRTRQLLQRLDRRNGMAVLDARNVATQQTCALLDVALRKFFRFSKQAKPITNYHSVIIYHGRMMSAT